MDKAVLDAYDKLVPSDQVIVDSVIAAMRVKDIEIELLVAHIMDKLDGDT